MSRDPRYLATSRPPVDPTPSEALSFAQAILGESFGPRAGIAASDGLDWEQLEFLASISPEHERKLRDLAQARQIDSRKREQLEWVAGISTDPKRRFDELLREEAAAAEVRQRASRCIENLERLREIWDDSKHPRAGGPPNAGWFASTGGSAARTLGRLSTPSKPDGLVLPRGPQYLAQVAPPAQGGQGGAAGAQPQAAPEIKAVVQGKLVRAASGRLPNGIGVGVLRDVGVLRQRAAHTTPRWIARPSRRRSPNRRAWERRGQAALGAVL